MDLLLYTVHRLGRLNRRYLNKAFHLKNEREPSKNVNQDIFQSPRRGKDLCLQPPRKQADSAGQAGSGVPEILLSQSGLFSELSFAHGLLI